MNMITSLEQAILPLNSTMQDAINALNISTLKIVLIINEQHQLVGVITDGDIRRAILAYHGLNSAVDLIMSHKPVTAFQGDSASKIKHLLEVNKLLHIPILTQDQRILGIETRDHLFGVGKLTNPVFIMAGGFGTRLRPLTSSCPKPLLKVGRKPILENIIESFSSFGFEQFYISVHYKADMIKDYFGDGSTLGVDIEYIEEKTPLGTGGALSLLPDVFEPVILMNGDLLTKVDFSELLAYHQEEKAAVTMCVREYEFQVPYGVIQSENNRVTNIVEKPVEKYFVNAGIYVISPEVIHKLKVNEYLDMPDLINACLANEERISMFPIHEYWLDIGRMSDFERAQSDAINFF
ncbi:nucleoside-diphosphate-sugar pyrophosphorylase [Pseudoalteromonas tunicata D2]|jgi:dTDP-glucose pyrophosphorylase|uniref:Nucleoside-diphosphate-sugar pyrophosphorylase n=2 Tax=Pseudoalteromonas tunicata TaxID=314281 RepID=A4C6E7_9GAMM|nr:nucleoside-diphosphate-sugar pyrophosphorylase [Pseudoalteromonas tunicata D2]